MGLDMGDLEEFGYKKKGACGNLCLPFNSETWEEYQAKARLFNQRLSLLIQKQMEVAQCHPVVKQMMPKVQYVWQLFPLNYLLGPWEWLFDAVAFPLGWWLLPFWYIGLTIPWNVIAYSIVIPIIGAMICCFPCAFCLA